MKTSISTHARKWIIICLLLITNSCYSPDHEKFAPSIFNVVNMDTNPIYVEATAQHSDGGKPFCETELIPENEIWAYGKRGKQKDDYLDMKFYQNYPELKFTIMGVNSDGSCNYDRILDVIEVNQAQFFYLHRSIYYPLSDRDKQIIEKYK